MCTAVSFKTEDFYFGRTLDYESLYPSQVVITPRRFPLRFRFMEESRTHYAIIGMAYVHRGYPLYYDGMNEQGLCMAGLNFVGNAVYGRYKENCLSVAQFELIPLILSRCKNVREAVSLLEKTNITDTPFSEDLPTAQLHWMLADRQECITLEATDLGINIYRNPVGVLTNNPPFPFQMLNLSGYMNLSAKPAENRFSDKTELSHYSRGMGAIGLPGDLSSASRFVRAAFMKLNSALPKDNTESVSQFFHIMDTVNQVEGCCVLDDGSCEKTLYTCCMNGDKGIYYYTTYKNRSITAVCMKEENLDSDRLVAYPLTDKERIEYRNKKSIKRRTDPSEEGPVLAKRKE
ncbi:MAG: choloylglycine hydrolase [Ruminococcus sp.]|nr:choloylglycine hydrolase [Ruminococcus sp.]